MPVKRSLSINRIFEMSTVFDATNGTSPILNADNELEINVGKIYYDEQILIQQNKRKKNEEMMNWMKTSRSKTLTKLQLRKNYIRLS